MSEQESQVDQEIQGAGQDNEASSEAILDLCNNIPIKKHKIEGVGVVYVHGFMVTEKATWQKGCRQQDGKVDPDLVESLMFQMCVRDSKGKHKFKYAQIPKIRMMPAAIVSKVCDICMKLSGMGAATDQELLKNFAPIGTEDS